MSELDHNQNKQEVIKTWTMIVAIGYRKDGNSNGKQDRYVYASVDQIKRLGGFTCFKGTASQALTLADQFNASHDPNNQAFPHAKIEEI